jgi:acyl-coenzyme A synthetase/AMP-(fatty) acid ligase
LTIPHFLGNALEAAKAANLGQVFVFGEGEGATPFASWLQNDGQAPAVTINPRQELVVLPYSSGTTGLPKGVMLTYANLVANIAQVDGIDYSRLKVVEGDVLMGILPFFNRLDMPHRDPPANPQNSD